jgi:hypothetical protein
VTQIPTLPLGVIVRYCQKCGEPIKPGQLYIATTREHVACPSRAEVRRARRWGKTA